MTWVLIVIALILQTPARDVVAPPRAGTGVISGVVLTDDVDARPLRRVQVLMESGALEIPRAAVTDDSGRFTFVALPPANYTLTAQRAGYVSAIYGAKKPGRGPGVPIAIAADQRVTGVTLKMLRGAVITGMVRLPGGKPIAEVSVQARRVTTVNGQRQFEYGRGVATDDRGEYRIYGLVPGEYVVQASASYSSSGSDMRRITAAEITAAQAVLSAGSASPAPPPPNPGPSVNYSPVFFPGTVDASSAQTIALVAGQERAGVDLTLQFVATARVSGTVIGPDPRPPQVMRFTLTQKRATGGDPYASIYNAVTGRPDGSFSAAGVAPGRYVLTARAALAADVPAPAPAARGEMPPVPSRGTPPPPLTLWAIEEFDVNGRDVSGITLRLQQGMTVAGKVVVETVTGGTATPPDPSRVRITLPAVIPPGASAQEASFRSIIGADSVTVDKAGAFSIRGAAPGTYRFALTVPGPPAGMSAPGMTTWAVKSVVVNGRDVADLPLEIKPGEDVTDVLITVSDLTTEISGTVFDQLSRPTPGFPIVVFSTTRAHWPAGTARVRQAQPASDGKYRIAGLPAGEYYVCAVTDLEATDLQDAAFLESLAAVSFKITLAAGEKKAQDLKLGGK